MTSSHVTVDTKTSTNLGGSYDEDAEFLLEREIYEIEQATCFDAIIYSKDLRLGGYSLPGVPNSIRRFQQLEQLHLEDNNLTELPLGLGQLNIRLLDLQGNRLRLLPETFVELRYLEHLRLDRNVLSSLPDNFGNLQALDWLELQSNHLEQLPSSFCRLVKLRMLKMEDNRLCELPDEFGKLESLRSLTLTSNCLTALPDSFGDLRCLEHVSLELNLLTLLPDSFGQLESLENIYLGGNRIESLPSNFGLLKSLRSLSLGPINRFRFSCPRIASLLGLRSLSLQSGASTEECQSLREDVLDGIAPETVGNASSSSLDKSPTMHDVVDNPKPKVFGNSSSLED